MSEPVSDLVKSYKIVRLLEMYVTCGHTCTDCHVTSVVDIHLHVATSPEPIYELDDNATLHSGNGQHFVCSRAYIYIILLTVFILFLLSFKHYMVTLHTCSCSVIDVCILQIHEPNFIM